MCGKDIHMMQKLLTVVANRGPLLKSVVLNRESRVFMIAADYCPYSKKAWNIIRTKVNSDNFTIVDGEKGHYLCSKTFSVKKEFDDDNLAEILKLWRPIKTQGATYPDIYVHEHPEWYRVGGCDNLQSSLTIQHSDLLYLLPQVVNTIGTSSMALKL